MAVLTSQCFAAHRCAFSSAQREIPTTQNMYSSRRGGLHQDGLKVRIIDREDSLFSNASSTFIKSPIPNQPKSSKLQPLHVRWPGAIGTGAVKKAYKALAIALGQFLQNVILLM